MHVTFSLLACLNDFTLLMLKKRQEKCPSSMLIQKQIARAQPKEPIWKIRECINATAEAFEKAHYFLKLGEVSKAVERFRDVVPAASSIFIDPDLFLLVRIVEIATWSSWKKFPEFEPVVFRFLATLALQKLGALHPLTLLLGCFSKGEAISTSYPTLWKFVIGHIGKMTDERTKEAQKIRIKAYSYLVRVLRNNGEYSEAIQWCEDLIRLCMVTDGCGSFSANRAIYNLAVNHCEAGNVKAAMETYYAARKYLRTTDSPYEGWVFAVFAINELAQLYEQNGNKDEACKHYEEAVMEFIQCEGVQSSGALLMLKDLIEFCERHGYKARLDQVKIKYAQSCTLLSAGRLDDVRLWVGRPVTTQASGGKMHRFWTWTSPLV
jgi:tetratricopeptide (TPR) repeat protein